MSVILHSLTWTNNANELFQGLYEESHGIIANNMYDEDMSPRYFGMGTTVDEWWTGHETIWTSAQKAGLKAGLFAGIDSQYIDFLYI